MGEKQEEVLEQDRELQELHREALALLGNLKVLLRGAVGVDH